MGGIVIRTLVALGVAWFVISGTPECRADRTIDLDVPGNLEAVARADPDHFAKIRRILAEVPEHSPAEDSVARWMRTEFQARDIQYTDLVMTSLPPKKRLKFSLDGTSYVKIVTLTGWRSNARPLKEPLAK